MFLQIAPLARLPREREILTYSSAEPVPAGSLVQVPLGHASAQGVVLGDAPPLQNAKPIESLIEAEAVSSERLQLARYLADYYAGPLGQSLELFIPKGLGKTRRVKPESEGQPPLPAPLKLSADQQRALTVLKDSPESLLHGVTASGKTELYLRLISEILERGQTALMLVPEISLTPQAFERLEERFPGRVALWHSGLTEAERIRTWRRIKAGAAPVVVGSRSALFAPLSRLGLIVIDEEHDSSYKQESGLRYHARTAARELARLHQARLVMGSATPSVETMAQASAGQTAHAKLEARVTGALPTVEIVDLKNELKRGNTSTISGRLQAALEEALERGEQAVLFLNRRGAASSVACRDCGQAFGCARCSTTMTYHRGSGLICHHCGFRSPLPRHCPECNSERIRYFGAGTQTVEEDLRGRFPDLSILRLDRDATSRRGAHEEIFRAFQSGAAQILLGTQMVTKGWDIPAVSLVGVLLADLSLTLPDFRSGERTYQLLSQVAGRSGRGDAPGRVIVQTYQPDHPVLELVRRHDREEFYSAEIPLRKRLGYPPFSALACLTYAHRDEGQARRAALDLADRFYPVGGIEAIGPAPAFIPRLRGKYYYQLVLKAPDRPSLDPALAKVPSDWSVDIDPEDLLS
jgi:primosomal protein N' (replication factor Y) (superfamily II helicase)